MAINLLKWSNDENSIWETHPLLQLHPMASPCISTPTNQLQVCNNPRPMILQGSAFKVSHSRISQLSAELRPSSTPSPPSDSQFHYHQASSPSPEPDPGEDNSNSNPKSFIKFMHSQHSCLPLGSERQTKKHPSCNFSNRICVSYCEALQD
ncbi:hypothetical protein CHARACLAT_001346 [Characodon lateralis]|uniref:Uncharacterized protein n=1 Tax=Characodon lateralis TaxID=208331 RepID=A0ABU7D5H5_9TELE|nr:hypothetical protein [Characodon lateralis]